VAIFTSISKNGAIGSALLFLKLKLQNFATIICKVANKNLKIDPEKKKWCSQHHPLFFRG
jgi:hypothetical protein